MAKMTGAAHQNSRNTKAECNCGRRMCSDARKSGRRTQRRIEKQDLMPHAIAKNLRFLGY